MKCPRCQGSGKNITAMPIKAKVPGTLPGFDRYKFMQPLCPGCGGAGVVVDETNE
jgi:DnaJ-class molecular chaperone